MNGGTKMCCMTTIEIALMFSKNNGVNWFSPEEDGDGNG